MTRAAAPIALGLLLCVGCAVDRDDGALASRETHWLQPCVDDGGCAEGLTCLDRQCTTACSGDGACGPEGLGACVAGVCQAHCDADAACDAVRPGLQCVDARCESPLAIDWGCPADDPDCGPVCTAPASAFAPGETRCRDVPGAEVGTMPGTGIEYCVAGHPDCRSAGAACPLVVTNSLDGRFLAIVNQPERYGPVVVAEFDAISVPQSGPSFAELPRLMFDAWPGIDRGRVYAAGADAGLRRGLCRGGPDSNPAGASSVIYAAVAFFGECPGCDNSTPLAHPWDALFVHTEGTCDDELDRFAAARDCRMSVAAPAAGFAAFADRLGEDGGALTYARCADSDLLDYRLPADAADRLGDDAWPARIDLAWAFFQGRTTDDRAWRGPRAACE